MEGLGRTLLPLTLDIEHYARTKVNRIISERSDEDGYMNRHNSYYEHNNIVQSAFVFMENF